MSAEELLVVLKKKCESGEFMGELFLEEGEVVWQYDFGSIDEPGDVAWDSHCEATKSIREVIGEDEKEWVIMDAWSDNDTCGFTIKKNENRIP
jgi:hypothetical protein